MSALPPHFTDEHWKRSSAQADDTDQRYWLVCELASSYLLQFGIETLLLTGSDAAVDSRQAVGGVTELALFGRSPEPRLRVRMFDASSKVTVQRQPHSVTSAVVAGRLRVRVWDESWAEDGSGRIRPRRAWVSVERGEAFDFAAGVFYEVESDDAAVVEVVSSDDASITYARIGGEGETATPLTYGGETGINAWRGHLHAFLTVFDPALSAS